MKGVPAEDGAEDGIRDRSPSRGLGDVYKRQAPEPPLSSLALLQGGVSSLPIFCRGGRHPSVLSGAFRRMPPPHLSSFSLGRGIRTSGSSAGGWRLSPGLSGAFRQGSGLPGLLPGVRQLPGLFSSVFSAPSSAWLPRGARAFFRLLSSLFLLLPVSSGSTGLVCAVLSLLFHWMLTRRGSALTCRVSGGHGLI